MIDVPYLIHQYRAHPNHIYPYYSPMQNNFYYCNQKLRVYPSMDQFVKLRRQIHQYPQTSGKQHKTTARIREIALGNGVQEEQIKMMPSTGLWIDLAGKAEAQGNNVRIALRADIDALQMSERNQNLQYRSMVQGAAHMCGHDGHIAVLAASIPLFLQALKTIPKNKSIRLIFQPSQEDSFSQKGAKEMIKQGCLDGVSQIYGFHNVNVSPIPFGYFSCKAGVIMSSSTVIKIKITGTGGHGSEPQNIKYSLPKAITFYQNITSFTNELKQKYGNTFTAVFPILKSGQRYNVISQSVELQGNLRTFSNEISELLKEKVKNEIQAIQSEGFQTQLFIKQSSLTQNHQEQSDHVHRVAKKLYGEKLVGNIGLPTKASQDFGEYTKITPGAFFFVSGADETHEGIPHNPNYNFNDRLIPLVSNFWLELALDRFASL